MTNYTAVGVTVTIRKMDELSQRCVILLYSLDVETVTSNVRMDVMLQLFQEFVTPQQKILAAKVEQVGRDAVLENEEMMKELVDAETSPNKGFGPQNRPGGGSPFDLDEIRREIKRDPEEVIKMNSEFFNRKFAIQVREIEESMARVVGREGDRIISTLQEGPHDRIADEA